MTSPRVDNKISNSKVTSRNGSAPGDGAAGHIAFEKVSSPTEYELAEFLENALEGISKIGSDGTILWANRAQLDMLGLGKDEFVGRRFIEFHFHPEEAAPFLEKLYTGQPINNYPAKLVCKDRTVRNVLIHLSPYLENGHVAYTRCYIREISDRFEHDIVERRLASIVDSSNDAIVGKTLDGIITSWNKGAERMFGYSSHEAIGRPKTLVFPSDRLQEEIIILQKIRRGQRIDHFESKRRRKDGEIIDVSISISPLKDQEGRIIGASTIERDITEAKQRQRELEDLNERLRRAMRETHHRVKNNLQLISAVIELLELDHKGEDAVPLDEFARLRSQVSTIAVVHDLLSKVIRESEEAQLVSVHEVLNKLIPMLQRTALKQTVTFHGEDAEIPAKQSVSLALITNELVSNALKHGKSVAEVKFKVSPNWGILEVVDDGPGFPDGFDPIGAANIGLELVESLVRTDLSGTLEFCNLDRGGGLVRISFPLQKGKTK